MMDAQQRYEELVKLRALKRANQKATAANNSNNNNSSANFMGSELHPGEKQASFVGTCPTMCPEFECLERQLHLDLTRPFEVLPSRPHDPTSTQFIVDPARAVKKYHRPAAGDEAPLAEDVRPPAVLLQTLEYLLSPHVLQRADVSFVEKQKFLRDRMRGIRQDLTLQNEKSAIAIYVNECIARFHIYCGVALLGVGQADFDPFQNLEQLRKVLQTLYQLYEDGHAAGGPSSQFANEAEFQSYRILAHLADPLEAFSENAPPEVQRSPVYQDTLQLACAFHTGNLIAFQRIYQQQSFLFRALAFSSIPRLKEKLQVVVEKAFEKNSFPPEWSFRLNNELAQVPNYPGEDSLAELIKQGTAADSRSIELKRRYAQEIFFQLLIPAILLPELSRLVNQVYEVKQQQEEAEAKQRQSRAAAELEKYTQAKNRLIQQVSAEFIQSVALSFLLPHLIWGGVERKRQENWTGAKRSLIQAIYESCLRVCLPFYQTRVVMQVLAEKKQQHRTKRKTFQHWRHYSNHQHQRRLDQDDLLERLLARAGNLLPINPLYQKYQQACREAVAMGGNDAQLITQQITNRFPDFLFAKASYNTLKKQPTITREMSTAHNALRELQQLLAIEREHDERVARQIKELIKTD